MTQQMSNGARLPSSFPVADRGLLGGWTDTRTCLVPASADSLMDRESEKVEVAVAEEARELNEAAVDEEVEETIEAVSLSLLSVGMCIVG
jgi:hypothetical protein